MHFIYFREGKERQIAEDDECETIEPWTNVSETPEEHHELEY